MSKSKFTIRILPSKRKLSCAAGYVYFALSQVASEKNGCHDPNICMIVNPTLNFLCAGGLCHRWQVKDDGYHDPNIRVLVKPILNLFHGDRGGKRWKNAVDGEPK